MQKKLGTVKDLPKYDVASLFVPFMFTGLHSHSFQENQDKPIQDFSFYRCYHMAVKHKRLLKLLDKNCTLVLLPVQVPEIDTENYMGAKNYKQESG